MGNMAELRPGIIDCGTEITLRSSPSPTSVGFKCLQGDIKITVSEVIQYSTSLLSVTGALVPLQQGESKRSGCREVAPQPTPTKR